MKKAIVIMVAVIFCVVLCSCDIDPYEGKRPFDHPDSKWICEEYGACFSVDNDGNLYNAYLTIDGEKIPFTFLWSSLDEGVSLQFELDFTERSLDGIGRFDENTFEIEIGDTKGFYPESEIVLTFLRQS